MEREREIFLSSFGLSNDFSFKGVLHTVVALESNALSLSRERKKERKKESAEKKKKKKKKDGRSVGALPFCQEAKPRKRRENTRTNDFVVGVGGVSKLSDLDFTTLTRKDEVEVVLVERERERTRAIGRVSDAEEDFVRGVRDRNDDDEEEDVVVSRG